MGKYLDLDDVVAGNPEAEKELAELRSSNARMLEVLEKIIQNHHDLPLSGRRKCLEIAQAAIKEVEDAKV